MATTGPETAALLSALIDHISPQQATRYSDGKCVTSFEILGASYYALFTVAALAVLVYDILLNFANEVSSK